MEKMSIPVFIHHEGGASYVEDCVKQAEKYNKRVVLFGNQSNTYMCKEWYDVSKFSSPLWEEFKKYYKHMSHNGSKFEMMCFKRFFIFDDFMMKNKISACITLDSDALVFVNFSQLSVLKGYNGAFSVTESGTAWGGCGYWRREVLHSFLNYCIDIYKNHLERLKDLWRRFQKEHLPGGICDMTLLSWWYKEKGEKIWIWTKYSRIGIVDHCFRLSSNYAENEYYLDKLGIGKQVVVKKRKPYFHSVANGFVRVFIIHFQGDKKIYMHYFRKYMRIAFWLPYMQNVRQILLKH